MSRTLGFWLLLGVLACVVLTNIILNTALASLGLFLSVTIGTENEFNDGLTTALNVFFALLLFGEGIYAFLGHQGKFFTSALPNVLGLTLNLVWLSLAGLLFYGFYGAGSLATSEYHAVYFTIAMLLIFGNAPLAAFHALLCNRKFREQAQERNKTILVTAVINSESFRREVARLQELGGIVVIRGNVVTLYCGAVPVVVLELIMSRLKRYDYREVLEISIGTNNRPE